MNKLDPLNDGILLYGTSETIFSDTKKMIGKQFSPEGKLAFSEMSARDQDYSIANALSSTLDLKLRTKYPPHLEGKLINKYTVQIKGVEYETLKIDRDREKLYLYWYLQRVGEIVE